MKDLKFLSNGLCVVFYREWMRLLKWRYESVRSGSYLPNPFKDMMRCWVINDESGLITM